ncbi:2-dehydro-3-deoxygalactonokinase [Rhodopseudomonas boonkerdii]|uniref:2-dehydro-3-deoxygalactonokinase n=1 Tax=Rhodopseudomonas boonkerdii TaxID=475937 RepID=UPI001E367372|nr:2-dehydro-3-deoxygalactonokinase [Rhodopseudomonas boonkerdii]UGV25632.1 2-dehydro-3-deoxygalactonokinase [Rhodopseudomonas boonkerdii]
MADRGGNVTSGRPAFVAVDWGTSSFRGWLMTVDGTSLAETRGHEGMLHCATSGFAPVLADHLARLGAARELPVLICGMAGARQGWIEAPYLHTPTRLDALHSGARRVETAGDIRILPGIAQADAAAPDVMRGEETQLLGVTEPDFTGLVCIPGTHSKWIRIDAGSVTSFATYMTGELFSVIALHSILKHAVVADAPFGATGSAFRDGLQRAYRAPTRLTSSLFGLRAGQLLGFEQHTDGAAHLSGLLIGAELADAVMQYGREHPVRLIGAGTLGQLYATALADIGFKATLIDAEQASRRGLVKAAIHLWGTQF